MVLLDVNVLVYAHREDAPHHLEHLAWLEALIQSEQPYGLSDLVLSGFLRIVTHPSVFNPPSSMEKALAFTQELRDQPNCTLINPGPRHWEIFSKLCRIGGIKGNLVPDAFLAALAVRAGVNGSRRIAITIDSQACVCAIPWNNDPPYSWRFRTKSSREGYLFVRRRPQHP